jgi:D-arabinose 1-dehydrogenase
VFDKIRDEFPRESYQIITKIGRYGRTKADFDYSATRTRKSVENSMRLMKTDYLDGVYAHDVEFVSEQIGGAGQEGFTVDEEGKIRQEDLVRWGLEDKDAGTIRGPGDEKILEAFGELFKLKKEGKIRAVGFSGQSLSYVLLSERFTKSVHAESPPRNVRLPSSDFAADCPVDRSSPRADRHHAVVLPPHCELLLAAQIETREPEC